MNDDDGLIHREVQDQHGRIYLACGKISYSHTAETDREDPPGVMNPIDGNGRALARYSMEPGHVTCPARQRAK